MKTFEIVVEEAICRGTENRREVELTFDTQEHRVADLLTVKDVVAHFDHDELLDAIAEGGMGLHQAVEGDPLVPLPLREIDAQIRMPGRRSRARGTRHQSP